MNLSNQGWFDKPTKSEKEIDHDYHYRTNPGLPEHHRFRLRQPDSDPPVQQPGSNSGIAQAELPLRW